MAWSSAAHHYQIDFMDQRLNLPVLRVPLNLPKYRLLNGRTASAQEEWLSKNPDRSADFFRQDPESYEVQQVQHELLSRLVHGGKLLTYFRQPENKQTLPLILDCNGFVINGNRRLCAWRTLIAEDHPKFGHFNYVDVIVLPPSDDRAIDKLEGALQVEPDIRDDYSWDSLANMMRLRQRLHGLDTAALAEFYRRKEVEVTELLDMLDYADAYLEGRGCRRQWSVVSDKEYAFRQMIKKRAAFDRAGEKKLFEAVSFVLIDDAEGGRLYEAIPDAHKHLAAIKAHLLPAFPVTPASPDSDLDILGGSAELGVDVPLAIEIGKDPDSRMRAAEIIKDVIESQRSLDKDKRTTDFLLVQLQKANTLIQNAVTAGLKSDAFTDGVDKQLAAIQEGIDQIKKWLGENA